MMALPRTGVTHLRQRHTSTNTLSNENMELTFKLAQKRAFNLEVSFRQEVDGRLGTAKEEFPQNLTTSDGLSYLHTYLL
jgi:hypothetical protein